MKKAARTPRDFFICAADVKIPSPEERCKKWEKWEFDPISWELAYPAYPNGAYYPMGLDRLTDSAKVLDFIIQVSNKTWATDRCIAGLVHALNDILHPQSNLCSFGRNLRITPTKLEALVAKLI